MCRVTGRERVVFGREGERFELIRVRVNPRRTTPADAYLEGKYDEIREHEGLGGAQTDPSNLLITDERPSQKRNPAQTVDDKAVARQAARRIKRSWKPGRQAFRAQFLVQFL